MTNQWAALAAVVVGLFALPGAAAQEPREAGHGDHGLGTVHFETSCAAPAQAAFDRGLRYQHSFWYRESKTAFEAALKADPACAVAYWGIAQSLLANPFNPTPPRNLAEGAAAIEAARRVGAKSVRERDLIDAIGLMYADAGSTTQRARASAYAAAMGEVARRYPDDDEVQIFYALALDMSAPPGDATYATQLKAAAILEPIWTRQPNHPGVAHYLIHTYDYPALASRGLEAARRYATIAEAAPHAQHMPSHIFTRVGAWRDSIAANTVAARLAEVGRDPDDALHASDYLVYAHLQLGQDDEARRVLAGMPSVTGYDPARNTGPFALAASPARLAVERGAWAEAARLPVRPTAWAYADALTHFARALGAARSGHPEDAAADLAALAALRQRLREARDDYWAGQVDIQWQAASAWTQYAGGAHDEALALMRAAADAEDATDKAVVTPGPLAPARELYAAMLFDRMRYAEALAAYESTLRREPNRFNALAGAARAAGAAGDDGKAKTYAERLVVQAGEAGRRVLASQPR